MPIDQATKILVLKVRGRRSMHTPEPNMIGFHGLNGATTKRRYVGQVFEIAATPYKPGKSYEKGVHDTEKRVEKSGDERDAICAFMITHRGWTKEQCDAYKRYQFFDPETMELVEPLADVEIAESEELPNDFLLSKDEKGALKAIRGQEDENVLKAWLDAEKVNPAGARTKIVKFLEDSLDN